MGVNASGLGPKLSSFNKLISDIQPSLFFLEETKFTAKGNIKIPNYKVFELLREKNMGGGIAIGALTDLKPVWVRDGGQDAEALSIQITIRNMKIRCIVAYGCQENDQISKKRAFWSYLDEDVNEAKKINCGVILQFDGNLWAGSNIIPNDPRPQNRNGKMFSDFLLNNPHLTVVNSLNICQGLLTRVRNKGGKLEGSILDFFVVCAKILPHIVKMEIDQDKRKIFRISRG